MQGKADHSKKRAARNRTLMVDPNEAASLKSRVAEPDQVNDSTRDKIVKALAETVLPKLRVESFDMLFADPPYNLTKRFGKEQFKSRNHDEYEEWLDSWLRLCVPLLKKTASIYICGDWRSMSA